MTEEELEKLRKSINYNEYKLVIDRKKALDSEIERLFESKFNHKLTDEQYRLKMAGLKEETKRIDDSLFKFDTIKLEEKELIQKF